MLLSSLRKMRAHIASESTNPLTDEAKANRTLVPWLDAASKQIEKHLGRSIQIKERVQYFDLTPNTSEFYPYAYPISDLSIVEYDSTGLWEGAQSEITDCFIGVDNYLINLPSINKGVGYDIRNSIRITYTGGLAYHAVNSRFTMTSLASGQSWTVGKYIIGSNSFAVGLVNAIADSNALLTVENYYGTFLDGEELIEYDDEAGLTATGMSGTISDIERQSLAESAAPIVLATQVQTRYYFSHTTDFENDEFEKDTTKRRRSTIKKKMSLQEEVIALLDDYVKVI